MERHSTSVTALPMAVVWQEPAIAHREAVSQARQAKAPFFPPQTTLPQVVSPTEASEDLAKRAVTSNLDNQSSAASLLCMHACVPAYRYESETYKGCSGIL